MPVVAHHPSPHIIDRSKAVTSSSWMKDEKCRPEDGENESIE
jgi:hypothetical protein